MTERHNNDNFPGYEKIKSILNESPDLMCRKLEVGQEGIHIIFMKNLIKPEILNEYVIKYIEQLSVEYLHYTYLMKNIPIEEIMVNIEEQEVISSLLNGFAYIYFLDEKKAFMVNCANPIERSIEKAVERLHLSGQKN